MFIKGYYNDPPAATQAEKSATLLTIMLTPIDLTSFNTHP